MVLWVKALHVISIIAWMAGMLYLPRLFVYHAEVAKGSEASETFKVMERRLLKAIMNPSMILVFVTGFMLVYLTGDWREAWWQAKFILVSAWPGCTDISLDASAPLPRTPMRGRRFLPDLERGSDDPHGSDRGAGGCEAILTPS